MNKCKIESKLTKTFEENFIVFDKIQQCNSIVLLCIQYCRNCAGAAADAVWDSPVFEFYISQRGRSLLSLVCVCVLLCITLVAYKLCVCHSNRNREIEKELVRLFVHLLDHDFQHLANNYIQNSSFRKQIFIFT